MSVTTTGNFIINFLGSTATQDPLFGGGGMLHIGAGTVDWVNQTLGQEVHTQMFSDHSTISQLSEDTMVITDVGVMQATIPSAIAAQGITEMGVSLDGQMVLLQDLVLTSGEPVTLQENPDGSLLVEWSVVRKRSNQSQLIIEAPEYEVWLNPIVSNSGNNRVLLDRLRAAMVRKDDISVLESFSQASNSVVTDLGSNRYELSLDVALEGPDSLVGPYPHNTVKEWNIGTSDADDKGLLSVTWFEGLTREPGEAFQVKLKLLFEIQEVL